MQNLPSVIVFSESKFPLEYRSTSVDCSRENQSGSFSMIAVCVVGDPLIIGGASSPCQSHVDRRFTTGVVWSIAHQTLCALHLTIGGLTGTR